MNFLENHKLFITPLSPIHIGTGEDYEPTNYIIADGQLISFDPTELDLTENDRSELLRICNLEGDDGVLYLQRYFYSKADSIKRKYLFTVPVANGVIEKYNNRIGQVAQFETEGRAVKNRLMIEKTYFNLHDRNPVIPGSSLKGAMRTAILDNINNGKDWNQKITHKELEKEILHGNFDSDPLRLIKVSDTIIQSANRRIVFQLNRKKRADLEGQNMEALLEILAPMQTQAFSCELGFQKNPRQFEKQKSNELRHTPEFEITLKQVITACNNHYLKQFKRELDYNKERNWFNKIWLESIQKIQEKVKNSDAFLLRIGKHSNAESLTLDGVRSIKITGKRGTPDTYRAETNYYWLASEVSKAECNLLPFGWLLVEIDKVDNEISAIVSACSEKMKAALPGAIANAVMPGAMQSKNVQVPAQRFQSYQKKSVFIQKKSDCGIHAGAIVTGILLEEKTKKGGWKVLCKEDRTLTGAIINSHAVAYDGQPGMEIKVKVTSVKGNQSAFLLINNG
jgi:CRISPR-associated protein Csm5